MAGFGNFQPPAAPGGVDWASGSPAAAFPAVGLASLAQGLSNGVQLGAQMNLQQQEIGMRQKQLENEAAYRNALVGNKQDLAGIRQQFLDLAAGKEAKAGQIVKDETGNPVGVWTATGTISKLAAPKPQVPQASMDAASAAYDALDEHRGYASKFLPEKSSLLGLGETLRVPQQLFQSRVQTSPENNMADAAGKAGTLYAAAVNSTGKGTRMTDTEVQNMVKGMGGKGIGDTLENITNKDEAMKDQLATRLGLSREEIEAYRSQVHARKALSPQAPASAAQAPAPRGWQGGAVHTYPDGTKAQWNGSAWVKVQ